MQHWRPGALCIAVNRRSSQPSPWIEKPPQEPCCEPLRYSALVLRPRPPQPPLQPSAADHLLGTTDQQAWAELIELIRSVGTQIDPETALAAFRPMIPVITVIARMR
jgi:hypothetical protein